MYNDVTFSELVGKTLKDCRGEVGGDSVVFETVEGEVYQLYHRQDCCESVKVEDICGDLLDLVGSVIIQAEESTNSDEVKPDTYVGESHTWTFYRIATAKGQVVLRWLGTSNGYYSESVDFCKC